MSALFKNLLIVMVCCLMAMTMANAEKTSGFTIEPDLLNISIGEVGTFNITLSTDLDNGSLEYDTTDDLLHAQLVNSSGVLTPFGRTGSIDIEIPEGLDEVDFKLNVKPLDGIAINVQKDVGVTFMNSEGIAKAMCTGNTNPVPELITLGLMSIGVLALLGLVIRQQRKD